MSAYTKRRYQGPVSLSNTLRQVLTPTLKQVGKSEGTLLTEWSKIVGADVASKSVPVKLVFTKNQQSHGILHMQVYTPYALDMQHMSSVIIEKIATYFGFQLVEQIKMSQIPLPVEKAVKKVVTPQSSSHKAIKIAIEDEPLREALASLMTKIP